MDLITLELVSVAKSAHFKVFFEELDLGPNSDPDCSRTEENHTMHVCFI